jgi:DNA modification methylase
MPKPRVKTKVLPLAKLKPSPYNPRDINPENFKGLKASISRWGLVEPIVWNRRSGNVVGGHQRLKALKDLGETQVEVTVVDLPDAEEKALCMTLNNPGVQGRWTEDLGQLLEDVQEDLPEAVDLRLEFLEDIDIPGPPPVEGESPEDEVPDPPKKPISKLGDLWGLGAHRLLCGDSTASGDLNRLMGQETASLLATDPPYGVAYQGGSGNKKKREEMAGDKDSAIYARVLAVSLGRLKRDAAVFLWFSPRVGASVFKAVEEAGLSIRAMIIWRKLNAHFGAFTAHYKQDQEPCLYAVKGIPAFYGETTERQVWEVVQPGRNEFHPTQKPVELFETPIQNHTRPGAICLEPFAGSGTQIIAAEKLGRKCYAVEIDPGYVDVCVARWESFTGKKARRLK